MQRKILCHLIDRIFIPQVNLEIEKFKNELVTTITNQIEWREAVGFIPANDKIITLDLKAPANNLVENILTVFKQQDEKIKLEKNN